MILLYRDCFFKIMQSQRPNYPTNAVHTRPGQPQDDRALPNRSTNDLNEGVEPDLLPTISNEFILRYAAALSEQPWLPTRRDLIRMTEEFCQWLSDQDYTRNVLYINQTSM